MTEKKQTKVDFIRAILNTSIDDLIESPDYYFVGTDTKEIATSVSRFTRLRGILQRGNQMFTGDDNDVLITEMKRYIQQKNPE